MRRAGLGKCQSRVTNRFEGLDDSDDSTERQALMPPYPRPCWNYQELSTVVQHEPADAFAPETVGLFSSVGIKKGTPFTPDQRMKAILTDAVAVGDATARRLSSPRSTNARSSFPTGSGSPRSSAGVPSSPTAAGGCWVPARCFTTTRRASPRQCRLPNCRWAVQVWRRSRGRSVVHCSSRRRPGALSPSLAAS